MKVTFTGKNPISKATTFAQPKVYISSPVEPKLMQDIADFKKVKTVGILNKNGLIQNLIKYRNKIIKEITNFRQDGSIESVKENQAKGRYIQKYFGTDNKIIKSEQFRKKGTCEFLREYNPNGSFQLTQFFNDGKKIKSISSYDADETLIEQEVRRGDETLDFTKKRMEDGTYTEMAYDEKGENIEEITYFDNDENPIKSEGFRPDKTLEYSREYHIDGSVKETYLFEDQVTVKSIENYDADDKLIEMQEFRKDKNHTLAFTIERQPDRTYIQYDYDENGKDVIEITYLDTEEKPQYGEGLSLEGSTSFLKEYNPDSSFMETSLFKEDESIIKAIGDYDPQGKLIELKKYRFDGTNDSYTKRLKDGSYIEEHYDNAGENIVQIAELDENLQETRITEFFDDNTKIVEEFNRTGKISKTTQFNEYGSKIIDFSPQLLYEDLNPTIQTENLTEYSFSADKQVDLSKIPYEDSFPSEEKWDLSYNPAKKQSSIKNNEDLLNTEEKEPKLFDTYDDLEDPLEGIPFPFGKMLFYSEN